MVEEYPTERYNSRIEDVALNNFTIAMPMRKGQPVYINHSSRIIGKVFAGSVAYQFKSSLLDKRMHPLPVWVVSLPTDVKKIQQRAFVRVDAVLPIMFKLQDDGDDDRPLFSATTKDISGGGLRMIFKESIKLGTRLEVSIELLELGIIETLAEVVRVDRPDETRDLYWIGLKYLNLPETLCNKIIKFVFKKQLEYRQRGI
ncbi:Flagellar brake protein YcgR [bioreactor metagenome]|uniref:Flagellar brake protein YcgR n=1 Tax=bioreactor metagenome TaxID=1076179 RepID=A0A644T3J8_9ZZZZ